jgi:GDP-4-dehydro-6-deoxy-D-mannose reductase
MRTLITGIAGFTGVHLAEYLLSQDRDNVDLCGIDISGNFTKNAKTIFGRVKVLNYDVLDEEEMKRAIREIKPDRVFHLAGLTFDPDSRESPKKFYATNVLGTVNLLEAIRESRINPLIHIPCSGGEYGLILENENPVTETNPFRPISPYAISKLAQDMIGYQYYKNYGLGIIRTRAFNITGPGERKDFVCSNFAWQIAMIEKDKQEPTIYVGNLEAKRDFVDVRDAVRAYWLALTRGIPGEVYNVCSGKAYSMGEILGILLKMTKEKITVRKDPKRMRPSDIPLQVGSFERLHKQTGWKPIIAIEETLEDLLNYWREKV